MNRELLEQPFGQEQIKHRTGNFGNTLGYIEGHTVIQRLNDSLEGNWSFEVQSHEILYETGEVMVLGKLIAEDIIKMQFGVSRITKAKDTGEIISIGDDLKSAATDALKKTATQLGVGLQLYTGQHLSKNASNTKHINNNNSPHEKAIYCGNGREAGGGAGGGSAETARITNRQLDYILNLGTDINLDSKGLDKKALEIFGVRLSYLDTKEASILINTLKRKAA